jgi:ribosome-associated protein
LRSSTLAKKVADLTFTKKAHDVITMDLRTLTSVADFFVVCSADSETQMKAIAEAVDEGMEREGVQAWHREIGSAQWVLLDYVDVVLHVFHKNARAFYSLEKLWGDAIMKTVRDRKLAATRGTARRTARTPRRRTSLSSPRKLVS